MKFNRTKITGILSGLPEWHYQEEASDFKVIVTGDGVVIRGESPTITSHFGLETFARCIGEAIKDYRELKAFSRSKISER